MILEDLPKRYFAIEDVAEPRCELTNCTRAGKSEIVTQGGRWRLCETHLAGYLVGADEIADRRGVVKATP